MEWSRAGIADEFSMISTRCDGAWLLSCVPKPCAADNNFALGLVVSSALKTSACVVVRHTIQRIADRRKDLLISRSACEKGKTTWQKWTPANAPRVSTRFVCEYFTLRNCHACRWTLAWWGQPCDISVYPFSSWDLQLRYHLQVYQLHVYLLQEE